jgi:hypothetical protein
MSYYRIEKDSFQWNGGNFPTRSDANESYKVLVQMNHYFLKKYICLASYLEFYKRSSENESQLKNHMFSNHAHQ